jgi:hypothetical protein
LLSDTVDLACGYVGAPDATCAEARAECRLVVGTADGWRAPPTSAALLRCEPLDIPGRDHMQAVGDKVFKAGVLAFLAVRP